MMLMCQTYLNDYADNGDPGGACTYNTTTGIPDENCYFVPNPDADVSRSSNITSSSYDIKNANVCYKQVSH